ncbi:MAG: hypothetical protein C4K49_00590 [Candidatus Thorarchaeota archaeon]|nr:MAG: hypothetical protein C4K49_00590 [Candidatus Thorarchaeota archaeon]
MVWVIMAILLAHSETDLVRRFLSSHSRKSKLSRFWLAATYRPGGGTMNQAEIRETARMVEMAGLSSPMLRVFQVRSDYLLPSTYVIESPSALKILLRPWIVGGKLASYARRSTAEFLRVAYGVSEELRDSHLGTVTEVIPLAGSLYYGVAEAFESVFGEPINRCFIGAKRQLSPTGWVTELAYENFEALSPESVILIGDTIATGGTIERILDATLARGPDIRAVIVYSIAGGLIGAHRLKQLAERLHIPIYLFFSNAIFGVESNGTDMPWLHPGTVVSPGIRAKAESTYGTDLGRRWCCVWDWGDRAKQPLKHLEMLLARCDEELHANVTEKTKNVLEKVRRETQNALEEWKKPLQL